MIVILFLILILVLIAGAIWYLAKRFSSFLNISFKGCMWGLGSVTVLMLMGNLLVQMSLDTFEKITGIVSSFWMISLLFLVISFAITDLINLFIRMKPLVKGISSLGIFVVIMIGGIVNAYSVRVKEITIPVAGLTKEIRAVHVTDIHLGNYRGKKYLDRLTDKIIALNPDVVFNTGDMFDTKVHFHKKSTVLEPLRKLTIPQYFVYGNHDQYVGTEEVVRRMKDVGVIVLQNEVANFGELQIIGLNNMPQDTVSFDLHTVPGSETIESVMEKIVIEPDRPAIVLHHRPEGVKYMHNKNAGLLLAGHTHAGQLFPFTIIAGLMFEYNKGIYHFDDMPIYVSEGAGTIFVPLRLGTRSDITLITLTPKPNV